MFKKNGKEWFCTKCGGSFKPVMKNINKHMRTCVPVEDKFRIYVCKCGEEFYNKLLIQKHLIKKHFEDFVSVEYREIGGANNRGKKVQGARSMPNMS